MYDCRFNAVLSADSINVTTSVPFLVSALIVLSVCSGNDHLRTQTLETWPFSVKLWLADSAMLPYHLLLHK